MQQLLSCKNVSLIGVWSDPKGVYGKIPVFEINEPTAEEWNEMCRRQFLKQHESKYGKQECFPEVAYREWQKEQRRKDAMHTAGRKAVKKL